MYRIGIDLGGTNIAAGIVDGDYKIVSKGSVPTIAHRDADEIVKDMAALCKALLKDAGLTLADVELVGAASPGNVDRDLGVVVYANNIKMKNYPLAEKLGKALGFDKIEVENDANAAALGEAIAGCGKGVSSFVMVTLGTGVGGGIVIDGKIYSGYKGAGAELGHMVIEHNGVPCTCGRRGCFESYSSATGLIRMTRNKMLEDKSSSMWRLVEGDIDRVSGRTAFKAAAGGDKSAREVCAEYIDYLSCGLANVINVLRPEILALGGGVSHEGPALMEPLIERVLSESYGGGLVPMTEIVQATLGNDAGIIGAAYIS